MSHQLAPFMKRFFSHYLPVQKGLSVNTLSSCEGRSKTAAGGGPKPRHPSPIYPV